MLNRMKPYITVKNVILGLLLAIIYLYYFLSVVRIDLEKTSLLDLPPYPDSAEYYATARLLHTEGTFSIQVGDSYLPPRYPALFPILQQPLFFLFDRMGRTDTISIPFLVNQVIGFFTVTGLILYFFYMRAPIGAVIAGALLVTQPAFVVASRLPMTETGAMAVILLYFLLCTVAIRRKNIYILSAAAILIGIATNLRLQMIGYTPLVFFASLLIVDGPTRMFRWRNVLLYNIGAAALFLFGASPMLLFNGLVFGSPLSTGYNFHLPGTNFGNTFGFKHVAPQLVNIWNEFTMNRDFNDTAHFSGGGLYYTPVFFVLAFWSMVAWAEKRRINLLFLGAVLIFLTMNLSYFFVSTRMHVTIGALAIIPIAWTTDYLLRSPVLSWKLSSYVFLALLALTLVGYPSMAGFPLEGPKFQSYELLLEENIHVIPLRYRMMQQYNELHGDENALIVSDENPVYMNSRLDGPAYVVPINTERQVYRYLQYQGLFTDTIVEGYIETALEEDRAVYFVSVTPTFLETSPLLSQYAWSPVRETTDSGYIFQLVPGE